MALQYNNSFMNQDDFIREPKIRVYVNESNPSSPRERRVGDKERYPSLYKIFNNKPSFGESGVLSQTAVPSQDDAFEPVKYSDNPRTRSPQPQLAVQTHDGAQGKAKFVGYKNQAPVPSQQHVISYPKALPEKVESVKYDNVGNDGKQTCEVGEIECINAAAAGFIEWKRRTLAMCKAVSD